MIQLALGLALVFATADPVVPQSGSVTLEFRSRRPSALALPEETWLPLGFHFPSALPDHPGFAVGFEGGRLRVDTDADGALDVDVGGDEALVLLRDAEGRPTAAVQLRRGAQGWTWSSGGMRVGKLEGVDVKLLDQDNDGRFDGVGRDALILGRGRNACYLSEVVAVDGTLYSIEVAPDGARIDFTPYAGPTGTLDLVSGQDSKAKLAWAVVQSTDRRHSFDLSSAREGRAVPPGAYRLVSGRVALGSMHATIGPGRSRTFDVVPGETLHVEWGGPVRAEFGVQRAPGRLGFSPTDIDYYGRFGELYTDFLPLGKSPEFAIRDAETGEVLVNAKFPGNC